ncbi:MAG: hypothetical protein JXB48_21260 [Candidatus Latescibacteria bacterium]|nr:hypothetical protein [Candidatus Latescibacterota bacterium]
MKAEVLYDNVDFNYSSCGGYIITKGRKYLTIERVSNYQGNRSGCKAKLLLTSATALAIIEEIEAGRVDVEYLDQLDYYGGYIIQ